MKLIAEGADSNEPDAQGRTALHECCQLINDSRRSHIHANAKRIAKLLLEHGANVDAVTFCAQTPLHFLFLPGETAESSKRNQFDNNLHRRAILKLILDWGADSSIRDHNSFTPMHYCAKRNMADCLRVFVSYGNSIYTPTRTGGSILHLACQWKCFDTIRFLCCLDSDSYEGLLELRDKRDRTPMQILPPAYTDYTSNLWLAARRGDEDCLRRIINKLANMSSLPDDHLPENDEDQDKDVYPEGDDHHIEVADDKKDGQYATVRKGTTSKCIELKYTYETLYVEGVNSKTIRMRWSCLHACVAGIGRNKMKEQQKVDVLRYLLQVMCRSHLVPCEYLP